MSKDKKDTNKKKERASKYEEKLHIEGSLEDVLKLTFDDPDEKNEDKKNESKDKDK